MSSGVIMKKKEFSKENIRELAIILGIKVDKVGTIELLNKIKKIFLLEEKLDNKVVQTYEEEPVKRLCSVLKSIGIDVDSYTELYQNYFNQSTRKRQELEEIIKEYGRIQENLENEYLQKAISLYFIDN